MKRILIFTCMVFVAVSVCFATEFSASGYNSPDNEMAKTVVTLKMDGTTDSQEVIQLYFTSEDPSAATTHPTATGSVSLEFNGDTTATAGNTSPLYVWWKIVSGGKYDIQLGIDAPLVNIKDNTPDQEIGWSACWTDSTEGEQGSLTAADDNTVSSGDAADYETITTHDGAAKLTTVGSREITITTVDVSDLDNLTAGDYQAYLTLTIVADTNGQAG